VIRLDRRLLRPVVLVWLLAAVAANAPYLKAGLAPPPGTRFVGFFYYVDDAYNYLSYAQQAEDGAFLFVNKLVGTRHAPGLVNLEWWSVGVLSRALGRHPALAYRLLGVIAAFALLWWVARWLLRLGLPETHLLPALALVAFGGGLGGVLFWFFGLAPIRCPDLATGLFPCIEMLANPHFVIGTALLLATLESLASAETARDHARAAVLGTVLGLVRPYDLVLLVAVRGVGVMLSSPPRAWLRLLLPLASLSPVVLYNGWLFYGGAGFATFIADYVAPKPWALGAALFPAALLALPAALRASSSRARAARAHFGAWAFLVLGVLALRPVSYSLQFAVGVGVPLLSFGAITLSRFRPLISLGAAAAMSTTLLAAVLFVLTPNPRWLVPRERIDIAVALRSACRADELVLAPPDIGLYAAGLSACKAYVSHAVAPAYAEKQAAAQWFYATASPEERRSFLDRTSLDLVVLPGAAASDLEAWLSPAAPFELVAVAGSGERALAAFGRRKLPGATTP
jgi:hypothetical protein